MMYVCARNTAVNMRQHTQTCVLQICVYVCTLLSVVCVVCATDLEPSTQQNLEPSTQQNNDAARLHVKEHYMYPDDPFVEEGHALNVTCVLTNEYDGQCDAQDIYFTFNGVRYYNNSSYVTVLNTTASRLLLPNIDRSMSGRHVFCYVPCRKLRIGQQSISVAGRPVKPNITECRSFGFNSMTCWWEPKEQDTGITTHQQLWWSVSVNQFQEHDPYYMCNENNSMKSSSADASFEGSTSQRRRRHIDMHAAPHEEDGAALRLAQPARLHKRSVDTVREHSAMLHQRQRRSATRSKKEYQNWCFFPDTGDNNFRRMPYYLYATANNTLSRNITSLYTLDPRLIVEPPRVSHVSVSSHNSTSLQVSWTQLEKPAVVEDTLLVYQYRVRYRPPYHSWKATSRQPSWQGHPSGVNVALRHHTTNHDVVTDTHAQDHADQQQHTQYDYVYTTGSSVTLTQLIPRTQYTVIVDTIPLISKAKLYHSDPTLVQDSRVHPDSDANRIDGDEGESASDASDTSGPAGDGGAGPGGDDAAGGAGVAVNDTSADVPVPHGDKFIHDLYSPIRLTQYNTFYPQVNNRGALIQGEYVQVGFWSKNHTTYGTTAPDIPGAAPDVSVGNYDVTRVNTHQSSLHVYWSGVPRWLLHDDPHRVSYVLTYSKLCDTSVDKSNLNRDESLNNDCESQTANYPVDEEERSAYLLISNADYKLTVYINNSRGANESLTLTEIYVLQKSKAPEVVRGYGPIGSPHSNNVTFKWLLRDDNGTTAATDDSATRSRATRDVAAHDAATSALVERYTLYWCLKHGSKKCQGDISWQHIPNNQSSVTLALPSHTDYTQYAFGISSERTIEPYGLVSSGINFATCVYSTQATSLKAPKDVTVYAKHPAVQVHWAALNCQGHIKYFNKYYIYICEKQKCEGTKHTFAVDTHMTSTVIQADRFGGRTGRTYLLWMTSAEYGVDESEPSEAKEFSLSEKGGFIVAVTIVGVALALLMLVLLFVEGCVYKFRHLRRLILGKILTFDTPAPVELEESANPSINDEAESIANTPLMDRVERIHRDAQPITVYSQFGERDTGGAAAAAAAATQPQLPEIPRAPTGNGTAAPPAPLHGAAGAPGNRGQPRPVTPIPETLDSDPETDEPLPTAAPTAAPAATPAAPASAPAATPAAAPAEAQPIFTAPVSLRAPPVGEASPGGDNVPGKMRPNMNNANNNKELLPDGTRPLPQQRPEKIISDPITGYTHMVNDLPNNGPHSGPHSGPLQPSQHVHLPPIAQSVANSTPIAPPETTSQPAPPQEDSTGYSSGYHYGLREEGDSGECAGGSSGGDVSVNGRTDSGHFSHEDSDEHDNSGSSLVFRSQDLQLPSTLETDQLLLPVPMENLPSTDDATDMPLSDTSGGNVPGSTHNSSSGSGSTVNDSAYTAGTVPNSTYTTGTTNDSTYTGGSNDSAYTSAGAFSSNGYVVRPLLNADPRTVDT